MRHPDIDFMMVMERRRDELAEAEHSRLVKEALSYSGRVTVRPPYTFSPLALALARGLSYTGELLLKWSCRLEGRYRVLKGAKDHSLYA